MKTYNSNNAEQSYKDYYNLVQNHEPRPNGVGIYEWAKLQEQRITEARKAIFPIIGKGCTIVYYTDRRAATITKVELNTKGQPKAVEVTHNKVICKDYFADEYEILPELQEGRVDRFTKRRNGEWYMEGQETSRYSVTLMLHYQIHSIDPSF